MMMVASRFVALSIVQRDANFFDRWISYILKLASRLWLLLLLA